MNNYLKNIKNAEILIILLFYLVFFIIGLLSFKDFGTSIDEWELRVHGFVNLKYVILTLFNHSPAELDKILKIPELSSYYGTHGAYFAMIISFIDIPYELPRLITSPIAFLELIASVNAFAVSVTKVKSLTVSIDPMFKNFFDLKYWDIIVGITALSDCLGPKVLNGLIIDTGKLNDL